MVPLFYLALPTKKYINYYYYLHSKGVIPVLLFGVYVMVDCCFVYNLRGPR